MTDQEEEKIPLHGRPCVVTPNQEKVEDGQALALRTSPCQNTEQVRS